MILKRHLYHWGPNHISNYYRVYDKILTNLERSCQLQYPNRQVLLIDNNYMVESELCDHIANSNCEINVILNLCDPPRPWKWVKNHVINIFPDKQFITVGCDLDADICIPFCLILFFQQYPQYEIDQLQPKSFDHLFLNYNGKPHEHRVHLLDQLRECNLLNLGHWTLNSGTHSTPWGIQTLGDMDIWNSHFLNIISETLLLPWQESCIISEKTFKPIVGLRPFVINGSPRCYNELQRLGFDCFVDIWPIDQITQPLPQSPVYDCEVDRVFLMKRTHAVICDIVQSTVSQDLSVLYQTLYPRLLANRERFYALGAEFVQQFCKNIIPLPTPMTA